MGESKRCPFCGCSKMLDFCSALNINGDVIEQIQHPTGYRVYVSETDKQYHCPLSALVFPVEAWNTRITKGEQ